MIAGEPVQRPVSCDDVWIVVATTNGLCITLLPTGPVVNSVFDRIETGASRTEYRRDSSHAILVRSVFVLNAAPENVIDKRFVPGDLFFVGLAKLFHDGSQP